MSHRRSCRDEVLDAVQRLEARHRRPDFDLHEIVTEVLSVAAFPESTVRTQIVSVMCADAPVNHANHTNDLKRVDRGRYRRAFLDESLRSQEPNPLRSSKSAEAVCRCREPLDPAANVREFLEGREPTARYASFDYCFNYFQAFREDGHVAALASDANMQLSCLHLGFYLASWGMLRGSTDLLKRSAKHLEGVVGAIASASTEIWSIDADSYRRDEWELLGAFASRVRSELNADSTSDTLVTKIMLGVFGNVPAFDTYFMEGSGLKSFRRESLDSIGRFYDEHAQLIDRQRASIRTLDFSSGADTQRNYTRAKIIDMIFFVEGSHGRTDATRDR